MVKQHNKLLIVDDNPYVINKIIDMLSKRNQDFEFFQANNGEFALKIAEAELPDLIITDWDMPILNGIQLIKNLKSIEKTKNIPIIMATAVMKSSEDLKTALDAGAVDYIRKPIEQIELFARVTSVLRIASYNKMIIENKNNEIAENTLMLYRNNKFNTHLIKKLTELKDANSCKDKNIDNILEYIINNITEKVKQDSWQKFELTFSSVHINFKKKLLSTFPELTNTELRLATLLRSDMKTKEIASILFQNPESIKVARSRLRKKLNLNSDQNLTTFLSSF